MSENKESFELLKNGSVKDIYRDKNNSQRLAFIFSDRYSVFDWGEMSDSLTHKGVCLSLMGEAFFKLFTRGEFWRQFGEEKLDSITEQRDRQVLSQLCEVGMNSHFQAYRAPYFLVRRIEVYPPSFDDKTREYDYSDYLGRDKTQPHLIPLEFIFRHGLPPGSSFFKRASNREYIQALGLNSVPGEGEWLDSAVLEMSTKLESTDRYLTDISDVQKIADMDSTSFEQLYALNRLAANGLRWFFGKLDIELWDGKFEWGMYNDPACGMRFMLVDSIGPDELRLSYKGTQLSKEVLRQYYRGSDWAQAVEKGKKMAKERGLSDWKSLVVDELGQGPKKLDPEYKRAVEQMYMSLTRSIVDQAQEFGVETSLPSDWEDIPSLDEVVTTIKNVTDSKRS